MGDNNTGLGDARVTRNVVIEALTPPRYELERFNPAALIRFEEQYKTYTQSAAAGGVEFNERRTKVACFNEPLLRYAAILSDR